MQDQYTYRVNASSTSLRNGVAVVEGIEPSITFSAPPEFQGEAGRWTAEHLILASVAACFVNTFSGMAKVSNFDFLSLEVEVEGILDKEEGGWRFTQINLRPRLKIALQKDCDRANRLLEKAEKTCLVVRSLNSRVVLEPEVLIEELLLEREQMSIDC
jgi:organic hydroperoxide reductase OsmC/OhrA